MTNPLIDPTTDPVLEDKDYAAELIGEGKRYKDIQIAAKSIVEKDNFIERLKAENAEMRASLKGEQKLDEFFDKIKTLQPAPGSNSNPETPSGNEGSNQQTTKALSLEEVENLLSRKEQERLKNQNLEYVLTKAKEAFGANFQATIRQKAEELKVSPDYLLETAKTQPNAFLKLVEADKALGNPVTGNTSVNTSALERSNPNEKNQTYYKNLRKTLGDAKFFTPAVQNELHANALRLGKAFFN